MAGKDNDRKAIFTGEDLPPEAGIPPAVDEPLAAAQPVRRDPGEPRPASARLALGDDDDRLPWLESADDIDPGDSVDSGRIVGFVLLSLVALALIVGAVWFASNRADGPGAADGSLIAAEDGPYKVRPEQPGGKTFAGTGDTSFAVSEGENRAGKLGTGEPSAPPLVAAAPAPKAAPSAMPPPSPSPTSSAGVGVQVGAYFSPAAAEQGWATLKQRQPALAGFDHRVVEGQADIGNVYRLQAVAPDLAAARALCAQLQAGGQGCQVKR